jgi:hypothetical protein
MNAGPLSWWLVRHLLYAASSLLLLEGLVHLATRGGVVEFGREAGPLEALHMGLQIGAVVLFAAASGRKTFGSRAFGLAAYAGVLGTVREADAHLDHLLYRGAYKVPAALLGVFALHYVWRWRRTIGTELAAWVRTPAFILAGVGAFVVLGFAQIAGQKELWQALMGSGYERGVKDAVEELVELLGYLLIFFSSVETYFLARRSAADDSRAASDGL